MMNTNLHSKALKQYDSADLEEWDIWDKFPDYRWTFNKLEVALKCGYLAAPVPKPVPKTGLYVIRPIYNLSGMGAGAYLKELEKDIVYDFIPGLFWCEKFTGEHLSVNYFWQNQQFNEIQTSRATPDLTNLSRFLKWEIIPNQNIRLPSWINSLKAARHINIEFIGTKIIEIHLRWGVDFPEGATEIIPLWSSDPVCKKSKHLALGYKYIEDYMDAEKNLTDPRLGFLYR